MKKNDYFQLALHENSKRNPDFKKMYDFFEKSYKQGNIKAAYALGTWYLHGYHVKKNLKKAIKLIKNAANANVSEALYDLAVSYEIGKGSKKSSRLAFEYYLKSALYGDKQSLFEVGRCYFYGIGVSKNRRISKIWIEKAKNEGITE